MRVAGGTVQRALFFGGSSVLFYADKALGSVKLDTWSLKVGVGI